jgi:HEAT repeat protein
LGKLTAHSDPWLRALAVRATGDLLSRDWRLLYTRAREDSELIVREAAASTLARMGGEMPETYQTLGTVDRILFLRQVPIFSNLAPEDLQRIAEIASERIVQAGDDLCREDEIGDELFVIVEGQVRVTKRSNGTERTLRILQAGEHVGELAILREQPRSASVIAEGGSIRVLVIREDLLKAILHDRPKVALAMLASLAEQLSTLV